MEDCFRLHKCLEVGAFLDMQGTGAIPASLATGPLTLSGPIPKPALSSSVAEGSPGGCQRCYRRLLAQVVVVVVVLLIRIALDRRELA